MEVSVNVSLVDLRKNSYPQFNFTNTCMIQDTMYTVTMKEANTLSKQIMSIEIKGYVRAEQQEEFEAWEKEQLDKQKMGPTPKEVWENFKPNPYGNGGGNNKEFINLTGNPEYSR